VKMALLYGIPLLLGSAGAFFAGSMFDEKEEEVVPVSEPGASILSPQSTETAPGGSNQVTGTNTSSFMPSINITAPGWMGGPPQQQPPQQQSSWFGGPAAPTPVSAPALASTPTLLDTIVPPSTSSGPDALEQAVGEIPPGGKGPDALEQVVGEIPPGGKGPDALEQAVGEIPPGGKGPDALEDVAGKLPPAGTGPDALEDVAGKLPTPGTGPDALEDVAGKLPPAGTGPDALEDVVGKLPPAGTGPDALEDVVGKLPPAGTGPDALEDVVGKLPSPGTGPDALSQVGPALSEPVKEIADETKRADHDAVPEAAALVGSLFSNAKAAVTGSPVAPSAPPADATPSAPPATATPSPTPDTPTPVEVPLAPVQIVQEEPALPPQGPSTPANAHPKWEFTEQKSPTPEAPAPAPEAAAPPKSAPELPPVPPEERAQITEMVNKRKEKIAKEEGIKSAATLTDSHNFGQSTTPLDKQGVNLRETRRAKARALKNARDASNSLRGKIEPLFGGRNRRNGNRWTHRRKH
jgi:hypothetical protein